MALIERKTIDKMEILENGKIQVREATIIEKDGVEIHRSFHRHIVYPGQDLTGQDPKVVAVANSIWTQEVIDAYLASLTPDPLLS
jgi:hypothetical protein